MSRWSCLISHVLGWSVVLGFAATALPDEASTLPDERIIAGYHMDLLAMSITAGVRVIDNRDLLNLVENGRLNAIVVSDRTAGDCTVRIARKGETALGRLQLGTADCKSLSDFATMRNGIDRAAIAIAEGRSAEFDRRSLDLLLNEQPNDLRQPAEAYLGAVALKQGLEADERFAPYIKNFQDTVISDFKSAVRDNKIVITDNTYLFPYKGVNTDIDLSQIIRTVKPKDVASFEIGGRPFRYTWVDGNLVVAPNPQTPRRGEFDPTGLGSPNLMIPMGFEAAPINPR